MASPRYYTVKDVAERFKKTDFTVRRWINEGREVVIDGVKCEPKKDPGGRDWVFISIVEVGTNARG